MKKYVKIIAFIARTSLIRDIQYQASFWLSSLTAVLWSGLYLMFYILVFSQVTDVKGWSQPESLIIAAVFLLVNAAYKALFELSFSQLPRLVYKGELDLVLVKPVSSQLAVSFYQLSFRTIWRFFLAAGVLIAVFGHNHWSIGPNQLILFLLLIFISLLIGYSLWFMTMCLVFWLGHIENIYYLFHAIMRLNYLPTDILPKWLSGLFYFVVPLAFMVTVPAKVLLGIFSIKSLAYGLLMAAFLLWLSNRLWARALKSYVSASS